MTEENTQFKNLLWPIIIVVLLAAVVFFGVKNASNGESVAKKALELINKNLKPAEMADLTFKKEGVKEVHGVFEVKLNSKDAQGKETDEGVIYITKDGKAFFPMAPVELVKEEEKKAETASVKSDKPEVNIFVMSYCPFGAQAERMFVAVQPLLKDKANIHLNYVPYIMHGFKEAEQNVRQYCIDKEQNEKFNSYLQCFVDSDNHTKCAAKAGIDLNKMITCYNQTMKDFNVKEDSTDFGIDKTLGDKYGVSGSPTFIINGKEANVERTAEGLKTAICEAFNTKPEECNTKLSTDAIPAGVGAPSTGTSGSAPASGSCN